MKPGDPVTVVTARGRIQLARVLVVDLPRRQFHWSADTNYSEVVTCRLDDEGITWIRQHHPVTVAEARALLAAWKLRPPRAMSLEEAGDLFRRGKMSQADWKANLDRWDAEFEEETR